MSNVLTKGKKKKADEAVHAGRLEEARSLLQAVCKIDRSDAEAWVKLGEIHRRLGEFSEAESCCRQGLKLQPRLGFAHYCLGAALHSQEKTTEAIECYRRCVELQPDFPDAHYLLGNALFQKGDLHEAVRSLQRAVELRAGLFPAWSDLGAVLIALGQLDAAESALSKARVLNSNSSEVLGNLGAIAESRGKTEEALSLYRRSRTINPDSPAVVAKLAELLERLNRIDESAETLKAGLARAPHDPSLVLISARLDRRAKAYASAIDKLEGVAGRSMPADVGAEVHLLLGQVYDAAGECAKAFPHLIEGKKRIAAAVDPRGEARERFLKRVDRARESVASLSSVSIGAPKPGDRSPIFLIGFPRSGTTLLEQILDSHPRLAALDERPIVAEMERRFRELLGDDADVGTLTDFHCDELRRVYFENAAKYAEPKEGVEYVDKLPLNIVSVPLIWRVFPDARFILALRHPCDVVLSCLMQSFGQNDAMAGFVSLQAIADIYHRVMSAWLHVAATLPLRVHRIRYEDLISNLEPECRSLFDFLGVDWSDEVLDHTEHARGRVIKTPSYHQVTEPIYQQAKYRWRRYENEFAPVLERLRPFIEAFKY